MTSLAESRLGRTVLELSKRGAIDTFIESGTYMGETARWASKFFVRTFSIELSEDLFKKTSKALCNYKNITLILGDSGECLLDIVKMCDQPALLWLDGHYSFGVTAGAQHECPILSELKALLGRKGDIVLIDDAHMFESPPKPPHRAQDWPLLPAIFDALRSIDPDYYIVLHENAVIAVPKYLRQALVDELFREESDRSNDLSIEFQRLGLWDGSSPLRLHLGCGELPLDGYVNIDFPVDVHNIMRPRVNYEADIKKLEFKNGVVDEVRLHHVFEHFSRVTALSLLIKWHQWLCFGGRLRIETPDLLGSASLILSNVHPRTKSAVVRHLVGDQSAPWAYHVDQWYPDRFQRTLNKLGYTITSINSSSWPQEPFLSNIEVIAEKTTNQSIEEQLKVAEQLLWDATVSDAECPTFEVWRRELYGIFGREVSAEFVAEDGPRENIMAKYLAPLPESSKDLAHFEERLGPRSSNLPINEIHDFNQLSRNRWVAERAAEVQHGSKVLDVGAGTCLYQRLFSHCIYVSQDFQGYDGFRDNKEGSYGNIDIRSDITSIPVEDSSFDVVLCTEVLEHVPEPILALKEMTRIVRPGGRLLLTAPLGSGLHQLPFHFYGGFSPEWYRKFLGDFGCESISISPNGGYFKLLAQECARFNWTMDQHRTFHGDDIEMLDRLFGEVLPRYLFAMDDAFPNHQFTVGYHVSAVKKL